MPGTNRGVWAMGSATRDDERPGIALAARAGFHVGQGDGGVFGPWIP